MRTYLRNIKRRIESTYYILRRTILAPIYKIKIPNRRDIHISNHVNVGGVHVYISIMEKLISGKIQRFAIIQNLLLEMGN